MDNNKNLILAIVLSVIILGGFHFFYEAPQQEKYRAQVVAQKEIEAVKATAPPPVALQSRQSVIASDARLPIDTPELQGSVNLKGGKIDDLALVKYRETVDPQSPPIVLFSPAGSAPPERAYFAELSWLSSDAELKLPGENTLWSSVDNKLTQDHPIKLTWDNGQGLTFARTIAVDNQFMFTITDDVHNNGANPVTLFPFGLIRRQGEPPNISSYTHEGPLGVIDGTLEDYKYSDLTEAGKKPADSTGGWLGFTDKYWLAALVPPAEEKLTTEFSFANGTDLDPKNGSFQADFRGAPVVLAANASTEHVSQLFAGPKPLVLLDHYSDAFKIPHFDRAIDFGRFYWLAEPFLYLLDYLAGVLGSFALAILAFTVILKIVTLPLSIKSYRSMAKMKALQPELKRLQERFADDKPRQGAEVLELYKREKVNPVSGCVPMVIQIPIFFALYKVLYIGIEMRQAPFYGWVKDMSIPDPTSILTLFGLFPASGVQHLLDYLNSLPAVFTLFGLLTGLLVTLSHIGVWPIFMGGSMFLQQKLSPQPPDKTQARIFMMMPIIFAFTMSQMPAGLVIYWTWSNLLSIAQQWFVMNHTGLKKKPA